MAGVSNAYIPNYTFLIVFLICKCFTNIINTLKKVEAEGVRCSESWEGDPGKTNSEENVSSSKKRKRNPNNTNDKNNNASEEAEQIILTEVSNSDTSNCVSV